MDAVHIRGGNALFGETKIQGSKNAVLPVMAAALLIEDISIIENCPRISDVFRMQKLLEKIGCRVSRADRTLLIDARDVSKEMMEGESVTGMRSSLMLLGAMLGRFHEVTMEYPGGCVIGRRPIDIHLKALTRMGVDIEEKDGAFTARAGNLAGNVITLPFPSVGATENVILAAVMARGITVLQNAAREPEIVALCQFLCKSGAIIEGAGGCVILIEGGRKLHGTRFRVPADRIVAGTYLLATLGAGGHVFLREAPAMQMNCVIWLAREMGAEVMITREGITVMTDPVKKPVSCIRTEVYPGFPTDLQSPLMAVLSKAEGKSVIEEKIFEDRFRIAGELCKMGACIRTEGDMAGICGVENLRGCLVNAGELRGGAGLVIAGCMAQGETTVTGRHFIERGYEDICRDLQDLGINIVCG
ncbi:UDP-N-acetylglucosamine 1-carboxyvinyltransferase [Lachnospiraceae bacterium OM04-12BH]|nr:UDP-N-acetylglucosamine 1-carboxyvinyltransferase [Lachnospiraceae bacterium OM04-12BH]